MSDPTTTSESVERLLSVVEDMTDFVVRWNPDGIRTFVNGAYLRCFGLTREEALGTSFLPLIHADDRELLELKLASLVLTHPVRSNIHRVHRGDGTVGWQHWVDRAFFDDEGRIVELQSVGRDVTAWREQQETLEVSEARLRALCRHAPIGIFLDDVDGKGVFVNERYTEIAGIEPDQAMLDGWMRSIHQEDRERVMAEWNAALANTAPVNSNYRFVRGDGEVRWVEGRAAPVRDAEHELIGYVGTLLDVTDRRNVTDRLARSEERFRALCDNAPVGIFLNDLDGGCAYVNPAGRRIAGLDAESSRADWRERVHPDERDDVERACARAIETRTPFDRLVRFVRPSGEERWGRVVAGSTRDDADRMTGYVGCIIDITDRIEGRIELERNLAFEQLVSRLSADFVHASPTRDRELVQRGLTTLCEYANADCAGIFEFSDDHSHVRLESYHMHGDLVTDERRAHFARQLHRNMPVGELRMQWAWGESFAGRQVVVRQRADFPLPEAAGDLAWLEEGIRTRSATGNADAPEQWNGSVLHLPMRCGDRVIGMLSLHNDRNPASWSEGFVEQMQLVAQLFANALSRRDAERRLAEQQGLMAHMSRVTVAGELAAGLAHEMNQPLYVILNCASAIGNAIEAGGGPNLEILGAAAAEIGRQAERAGEMVRRLRNFVQRAEPVRQPCRLSALIDDSIALATHELGRSGIEVDVDIPAGLPAVEADSVQIQQVLLNLLKNAIESIESVGDSRSEPGRVTISTEFRDNRVTTSVSDTGPGFDPECETPLDPFVSSKSDGMGIGLAICRTIIEAHRGRLWIADRGPEPVIRFSLPVAGEHATTTERTRFRSER